MNGGVFIGEGFKNYSPRHVQILGHRISLCDETIFKASKRFLSFCSLEKCFVKNYLPGLNLPFQ